MTTLQQRVQSIMERDAAVHNQFEQTSAKVDLQMMEEVEAFPMDEEGRVMCADEAHANYVASLVDGFIEYDAAQHGGVPASLVWGTFLVTVFPFMAGWPLREMLIALVARCVHHRLAGNSRLDYVEYFCGCGNLSKAAIQAGLRGVSLDTVLNPAHDCLEKCGLRLWLLCLTATRRKALVWLGCPCSSFVLLCKSVSLRVLENNYEGDETKFFVREGNCLGQVAALFLLLSWLLDCFPGLEQPLNSVLPWTRVMSAVLRYIQAYQTTTYHFAFGGPTLKPLQLWSCRRFMSRMSRPRPTGTYVSEDDELVQRNSDGTFTGHKSRLVASQAYTLHFGRCVIAAVMEEWSAEAGA